MNIVSAAIGILVLTVCFGLMVWGQRYLGEEKGRNPGGTGDKAKDGSIENPCKNCGACGEKKENDGSGEEEKE